MLVLPPQNARTYIEMLGKDDNANIEFEDMNAHLHVRPYKKYIQRIDEMERILRFVKDEIVANDKDVVLEKNKIDEFIAHESYELDEVEGELKELYEQFVKFQQNNAQLEGERDRAIEEIEVMKKAIDWLELSSTGGDLSAPLLTSERRLNTIAGVVAELDKERFRRALWRASRGNTFVEFAQIFSTEGAPQLQTPSKSVFVVYFQNSPDASTQSAMTAKVMKVCAAFASVRQYNWPRTGTEALQRKGHLETVKEDKRRALDAYSKFVANECADLIKPVVYTQDAGKLETREFHGNSRIEDYILFCVQEKSIYATLNLCTDGMNLRVDCWYPTEEEGTIKAILEKGNKGSSQGAALVPYETLKGKHPPTYIKVNDFTEPWQDVINTYGIPNYQSANPAAITTVTFPFIFGMMYGDIGHGTLLFCIGLALCSLSSKHKYGPLATLYAARILVLQLGFFAVFAGFMYNDFFGMTSLQLFESRYEETEEGSGSFTPVDWFDAKNNNNCAAGNCQGPYPFGVDWQWHGSSNELLYINSLKMKLSVLMGVIQMTLGLCLRVANAFHDRSMTDLICECIPMFVFMICFFGFMDYMILFKWTNVIEGPGTNGPPSIINSLICMAMFQDDAQPLWNGSGDFAHTLMTAAAAAVPIMLFPKPFILRAQHNSKKPGADDEESGGHGHGHGGEFEFGEVFIHQIIETIEYVLGTVSHTASYLRIWALSLAHQQLSLVFYQKTLIMAWSFAFESQLAAGVAVFFAFAAWFGVTSGVLLGMDVLECFLHTLRLHWVEFQSKFYKSDSGVQFDPYSIKGKIKALEA
jgi:V-type H+-transporting ATPase subunit a